MTELSNVMIGFPNLVDALSAYVTVAFSGGSWQAALPLTNLRSSYMAEVSRSTNAATGSTQMVCDLGSSRAIAGLSALGHNVSQSGRHRWTVATDSGFTSVVLAPGWEDSWPVSYPQGTLPIGHRSFLTGIPSLEEAAGEYPPLLHIPDAEVTGRYVKLEIDDATNPDGYVEIARLFVCGGHRFGDGMAVDGAAMAYETPVQTVESLGGVVFSDDDLADEAPIVRRVAVFQFQALEEDEAWTWVDQIIKRLGASRQLLFIWNPTDTAHRSRRTFVGQLRALPSIQAVAYGLTGPAFEILQVL